MRARKIVQYKPPVGAWRKMSWGAARDLILAQIDRNPNLIDVLNGRLKGATVQQFIAEREGARRCSLIT
ncbi:MAG: hypothetical protein FWC70_05550 [Defluviitaleaceae bacterium]|nr:hypothetical protein [Defluviitaleaceae bacterium]